MHYSRLYMHEEVFVMEQNFIKKSEMLNRKHKIAFKFEKKKQFIQKYLYFFFVKSLSNKVELKVSSKIFQLEDS